MYFVFQMSSEFPFQKLFNPERKKIFRQSNYKLNGISTENENVIRVRAWKHWWLSCTVNVIPSTEK